MSNLDKLRDESKDIPEACPHISKIQHLLDEMEDERTSIIWNELEHIREICEQLILSNASLYEYAKDQKNESKEKRTLCFN
jgi:hypothetical protein